MDIKTKNLQKGAVWNRLKRKQIAEAKKSKAEDGKAKMEKRKGKLGEARGEG